MSIFNLKKQNKTLYSIILQNKLVTICVLFTFFTLLDTIPILLGLWPAKTGLSPYAHLLSRFVLFSILMGGLHIFEVLRKRLQSKLLIYFITFFITWGILIAYIWSNSIFIELHPDWFKDISTSYTFVYLLLGIVILIGNKGKKFMTKKTAKA